MYGKYINECRKGYKKGAKHARYNTLMKILDRKNKKIEEGRLTYEIMSVRHKYGNKTHRFYLFVSQDYS